MVSPLFPTKSFPSILIKAQTAISNPPKKVHAASMANRHSLVLFFFLKPQKYETSKSFRLSMVDRSFLEMAQKEGQDKGYTKKEKEIG